MTAVFERDLDFGSFVRCVVEPPPDRDVPTGKPLRVVMRINDIAAKPFAIIGGGRFSPTRDYVLDLVLNTDRRRSRFLVIALSARGERNADRSERAQSRHSQTPTESHPWKSAPDGVPMRCFGFQLRRI